MHAGRGRIVSELFFWLRPGFVLRCVRRFERLEGFDRAIALASSAFTALVPLAILFAALVPANSAKTAAERVIDRFDLSSAGAAAVRDAFAPPQGIQTSVSVTSALLVLITVLGFARACQRLVERAWDLKPLSVRNTRSAALWILGLMVYAALEGLLISVDWPGAVGEVVGMALGLALGAGFVLWTGRLLSAGRVPTKQLLPFATLVTIGVGVYGTVSLLWVPQLFNSYATRYGVIGATFALISALFGNTLVIVITTAIGREVGVELDRIGRGERAPEGEVRDEWTNLIAGVRSRRDAWRARRRR